MLTLNNVEVMYGKVILVLKGMSMHVPEGKIVALLGSNGAGKTTTLRAISGLLKSENGEVTDGSLEYAGSVITGREPEEIVKSGIFQVMEGRRVFEHLSVEENLIAGAHTRRERGSLKDEMEQVYHYFPKLKMLRTRTAGYLSGGEQQMLAIGRALMARPRLLLLDEPSLGLAPLLVKEIFSIIKKINEEQGTTILVVEQNANVALSIADYGYIMENGRIVLEGDVESLQSNEDVREFYLGMSDGKRKSFRQVKHYKRRKRWL
ncbi:ABC transporter ATP-binding protein [Brevibacillus agri]|uniref:ABC transporter ATP-binding protein n=1 Tax=Brevibacillus agri TaxID=51101 RepID=A0A3M8AVZ0_9BACL|nr:MULTISPECIES: ABC transporter ATP-binding protein [Brevibacillus]ELK41347.1 branched-chain amino acid ABC transporter ATP-binding protein [Brevibacillus agri BAB-2500]EJL43562.1 ABC-type branched-chain amino acid transport system, ATPase component [Brevibacillus sp. CF112]MBG9567190.1 branched-chain amino acid ABC transporter ATP-binding protein [Brevibacillus agri]MBY0053873.1 ABC transporter ATP-binding protein [Brevibacillus agri]MCG5254318.1 ABC transporter ATP-binding protein [Brevibac